MKFLVAYIVSFMSASFLVFWIATNSIEYGYVTFGHTAFLILFSFLSGAFLFLGMDKYQEVSDEH
jgi:hypothetical protein